jgi:hypothetical protein
MKARVLILLLCCATPLAADYGPPVLETDGEFFAYGDFAANGLRGLVVIDRASGGLRQANATAGGGLTMADAISTGAAELSGVAVGRFQYANRDALAVTSPETNRVKIVAQFGVLRDAWPSGVGPRDIVGLPVPGGTTGLHGLAALTVRNHPIGGLYRRNLMTNTSGTLSSWTVQTPTLLQTPLRALAVVRQPGDTPRYAELRSDSSNHLFAIHDSQNTSLPVLTSCTGIPATSRICYGSFNPGHNRSVFIFHVPGDSVIRVSALDAGLQLSAPVSHSLGTPMAWVHPAPDAAGRPYLIGCDSPGTSLRVFNFNASNVPSLIQTFPAPAGRSWTGLAPAADGGWFAASAPEGTATTTHLQRFTYAGGKDERFAAGAYHEMAPLHAEELAGDILLFGGRPFFDNFPVLRGRLRAGGWTSNLTVGPAPGGQIHSDRETWQGPYDGLGGSGTAYLGFTPDGVSHGMANQIQPDASYYSLEPPVGLVPDLVRFDPPGGSQTTAVSVTLRANDPATTIRYSLGSTNRWTNYSVPLGPFATDIVIHAYTTSGTIQSPIISATYTFPSYPGDLDSDGDGVPDFVENHFGIHPVDSLSDSDMDGVPDLIEILAGTDPADADSVPTPQDIHAYTRRFNFTAEPLSHNGAAAGASFALLPCFDPFPPRLNRERTRVTITGPDGLLELEGMALTTPSGVMLTENGRIVPNPPLFWVAGTPDRFMINISGGTDFRRGRGVFRLLDWSATPLQPLPKPELTGSGTDMVNQWIAATRAHFSSNALVDAGGEVSYVETVDLLLAEQALGKIFHARGLIDSRKVTLTPFRGDALPDRHTVRDEWLWELPFATAADTGYDWVGLLAFIRASHAGTESRAGLNDLAREFYRIGYHAFADPAKPLVLAPFDALRQFMDTGVIPEDYRPLLTTPSRVATGAAQYRSVFLNHLPAREHTSAPLTLVADGGFDQAPWLRLTSHGSGIEYWLARPDGSPFAKPTGFRIDTGFRFLVGGHLADRPGGGRYLLVDSIEFLDAPPLPVEDMDNNLLVDSWEAFLYGQLGNNPFVDADGDGYSDLQEMFEWTAPDFATSQPGVPVVDLRPPRLAIEHLGGRDFLLSWQWPTFYQHRIGFLIDGTEDFQTYDRVINQVPGNPAGFYQTEVDATTHPPSYFYRAGMKLK